MAWEFALLGLPWVATSLGDPWLDLDGAESGQASNEAVSKQSPTESAMTTQTEVNLVDEQAVEVAPESDAIQLSLSDLDMVGGGAVGFVFA
jgi:hypothetical protein